MKINEVKKLTAQELDTKENELREEYGKLLFKHHIRPLENVSVLKKIKKDIARILTVKNTKNN